jgi:tRNA(adenine34) deaminase
MNRNASNNPKLDNTFMQAALVEAGKALAEDEVPIGAVLVKDNEIILSDHNRTRQLSNPLAHAEKLIIDSITATGIKYLYDYTLYVTLEPCHMCAGMLIWSRLGRLVFASADPKAGCVGSVYNLLKDGHFNHHPTVTYGILADEAGEILKRFFRDKRN